MRGVHYTTCLPNPRFLPADLACAVSCVAGPLRWAVDLKQAAISIEGPKPPPTIEPQVLAKAEARIAEAAEQRAEWLR